MDLCTLDFLNLYPFEYTDLDPDCTLLVDGKRFGVEFERCSHFFPKHGHSPEKCDLIVCWKHTGFGLLYQPGNEHEVLILFSAMLPYLIESLQQLGFTGSEYYLIRRYNRIAIGSLLIS